jgi:hypothetical protein
MGTYTKSSINRAARPRSERLREAGMSIVSTSAAVAGGGAGFVPSGSTHSHANLDSLNMITVADGYIYLTDSYTDETTGAEVVETVKASAGYADRAGANADGYTLDWFIPVTVNGVLTLKLNPAYAGLWAEGWISAGGVGTGGGGGGGASLLSELGDVSLGTLASGNLLSWNGTAWTNIAQSAITPDLSGYATQAWVNSRGFITSESDPVFSASAAAGIAATDIDSWNAKTSNTGTVTSVTLTSGTGITVTNSGTAITTTGSRTISISSAYRTYIDHGETAYGWGDHANAGYLTAHQAVTLAGGTNNGTLKITTAAGTVDNIAVTGLGSLAYKSGLVKTDIPELDYLPLTGGTLTGPLTMSGASILTAADSTNSIGTSDRRFLSGYIRNIYTTYFAFMSDDGQTQRGNIGMADGSAFISLQAPGGAAYGQYVFNATYGFFHGGNEAVPCGRSDHRWSYLYSVGGDFSGDLVIGGDIVPSADLGSSLGYSMRRFSDVNAQTVSAKEINFKATDNSVTTGYLSFQSGYMVLQAGANIANSYKQLTFHETYGFYPETAGVNLGYNGANYRWANIYGVNADLTGDLALAQTSHIDVGPLRIEYDATNKALHITKRDTTDTINYGLYADGFVAAGGVQTNA